MRNTLLWRRVFPEQSQAGVLVLARSFEEMLIERASIDHLHAARGWSEDRISRKVRSR
jgi:hypothetical protein